MKKIIYSVFFVILLTSCAPAHIWDLEYKVKSSFVSNAHDYKYVYVLYKGPRAVYLYTNKEYSIGQTVRFNQN